LVPEVEYLPDAEVKSIQQNFVAKYGRGGGIRTFGEWCMVSMTTFLDGDGVFGGQVS
jgi:hypothetical protein